MYYFILLKLVTNLQNTENVKCILILGTLLYIISLLIYHSRLYQIIISLDLSYLMYTLLETKINKLLHKKSNDEITSNKTNLNDMDKSIAYISEVDKNKSNCITKQNNIHFIRLEPKITESVKYTVNNLVI